MRVTVARMFLLLALTLPVAALASSDKAKASPETEKALRARVEQFYRLFQEGKFRQAEAFIEEESRDAYYGTSKARIMDFDIQSIRFEPDREHAVALITCRTLAPGFDASAPMQIPVSSRWKLVGGDWYMYLRRREDEDPDKGVQTPFGRMRFKTGAPSPPGATANHPFQTPSLDTLRRLYQVENKELRFQSKSKSQVTETVKFINSGPARLTLERLTTDLPGLTVALGSEQLDPGEETLITFTYDPQVARIQGRYRYDFRVQPIVQVFTVRVRFE